MEEEIQLNARAKGKLKIIFIFVGVFFILASVCIPLIIFFFHIVPTRMCNEETDLFLPSMNCSDDDFSELVYIVNSTCLNTQSRYLKYKLIDDSESYQFYNYSSAYKECQRLNASMWEVLDGESEWNVVIENIKKLGRSNVWLNANPIETCPKSEDGIQIDGVSCKHNDALIGNGLKVSWPSANHLPSTYSRLIRGFDSKEEGEEDKCAFVDNNNEEVWDVHNCAAQRYWGLCIKRKCFPSNKLN